MSELESFPESARELPLDHLHLSAKAQRALIDAGITTLGEFFELGESGIQAILGFNHKYFKAAKTSFSMLLDFWSDGSEKDWLRYWNAQGITVIPENYESGESPEEIIKRLPSIVKEIINHGSNIPRRTANRKAEPGDERSWTILQRRLGLEGTKELTLEDLGQAFGGLTRERIRQIEKVALSELRGALIECHYAGKNYRVHSEILEVIRAVYGVVAAAPKRGILETDLLDRVRHVLNIDVDAVKPSLSLLFLICGIDRVAFQNSSLLPVWGSISPSERIVLEGVLKRLDDLLTRATVLPMSDIDVLVQMNNKMNKRQKLDLSQLNWLIGLCSSIERRTDGNVWGRFEFLKGRGNQIARVLFESGQPMSFRAIAREINHRLVTSGQRQAGKLRTLSNQISADGRFAPIGKSGHWGLKSWQHLETGSIVNLMEEYLMTYNRPATVDEIYAYVRERRPVSKKSIIIYVQDKSIFVKADRTRWGLAEWPRSVVLEPNYKAAIADAGRKRSRKVPTLRQKIGEAVRTTLEKASAKQMELAELITSLTKQYDCPKPTLYQYVAHLDFVERLTEPDSKIKLVRIKGSQESLSLPQVTTIATDGIRQNVERALAFFNEDDVDVGLFLLSKEFEEVLKKCLLVANEKRALRFPIDLAPEKWRLAQMVDWATKNEIITDSAVPHTLRQARNDRAHGAMPTVGERRLLMNASEYLTGMYIGYIKLFDDWLRALK